MAYEEMQVVPIKDGPQKTFAFEYEESLSSAGNGKSILIPDGINSVTVQVEPSGCTVKVQATIDKIKEIINNNAVWVDWDLGDVTSNSQDACIPPSAIRLVQLNAGNSKIKVRAQ